MCKRCTAQQPMMFTLSTLTALVTADLPATRRLDAAMRRGESVDLSYLH